MAEACAKHNAIPWKISFKGTMQLINEFMPYFINSSANKNKMMYVELLRCIVKNKIGTQPGRIEPRMLKQKRKPFPTLDRPRFVEKERLQLKIVPLN